jgi:hypothetical protein
MRRAVSSGRRRATMSTVAGSRSWLTGLNAGSSSKIDGVQTTTFETGSHRAATATGRPAPGTDGNDAGAVLLRGQRLTLRDA